MNSRATVTIAGRRQLEDGMMTFFHFRFSRSALIRRAAMMVGVATGFIALSAVAADYPTPEEGDWIARDFKVHTGEGMPELHLHYRTVGELSGQPVVILPGTAQSGASLLSP